MEVRTRPQRHAVGPAARPVDSELLTRPPELQAELTGSQHEALEVESLDIHALFQYYNDLYFEKSLGACSLQWSSGRMTL